MLCQECQIISQLPRLTWQSFYSQDTYTIIWARYHGTVLPEWAMCRWCYHIWVTCWCHYDNGDLCSITWTGASGLLADVMKQDCTSGLQLMSLWQQWPWQHDTNVFGTGSIAPLCRPYCTKYTLWGFKPQYYPQWYFTQPAKPTHWYDVSFHF